MIVVVFCFFFEARLHEKYIEGRYGVIVGKFYIPLTQIISDLFVESLYRMHGRRNRGGGRGGGAIAPPIFCQPKKI